MTYCLYNNRYVTYDVSMVTLTNIEGLGDSIRRLRVAAGHTQVSLAAELGTTQSAVSRWERGHDEPRVSTLLEMLRVVGGRMELGDDIDHAQIREHLAMTPRRRLEAVANVSRMRALAG